MAYVNVAEWKTDQVCEWLKGLENSVLPYVHSFTNNSVNGQQLLNLRPEDLEQLGVLKLGHQEIILEAVEYLRNFHYELDRENLQLLALHLSCQAHSLRNELSRHTDSKPVATQTLSDVASVVTAVKPLVRWLDRPPFSGQLEYNDKKSELLKLSLEMATCAQRDRFAEKPIEEIRTTCEQLAKLADYIIQETSDPMILQPASLDLATLKKRPGDDLGFYILPSFHGNHQIAEIKFGSAAHTCGKMEEGDEIVQVNYQTVVGWERKNVLELFSESPAEVLLTLKRRPRHTKVYGQIYIKPYRLPSNKKTPYATRWQHNLPSPRPELLTIPDFTMPLPRHVPKEPSPEPASIIDTVSMLDTMASDSSDSDSEVEPPLSVRLYATKPRNLVQRRATITGASPTTKHGIDIEQFWKELKQEHSTTFQLRDKAASCAHGLDNVQSNHRAQACLSIEQTKRKKRIEEYADERKVHFNEKTLENNNSHNVQELENNRHVAMTSLLTHRKDRDFSTSSNNNNNNNNSNNDNSDITVPFDLKCDDTNSVSSSRDKDPTHRGTDIIAARCRKERGKLDKSYSTPAYDLSERTLTEIIEIRDNRNNKASNVVNNSATSAPSITLDETDTQLSNEILDNNEAVTVIVEQQQQQRSENDRGMNEEKRTKNRVDTLGTVAQRVNYIESHIQHNDENDERARSKESSRQAQETISRTILPEEVPYNEAVTTKEREFGKGRQEVEVFSSVTRILQEYGELGRESSEEKSESTSSYVEGTCSSSSEAELPLKKLMESEALIAHGLAEASEQGSMIPLLSGKNRRDIPKMRTFDATPTRDYQFERSEDTPARLDSSKPPPESSRKPETRARLTPPEPPPRKYFSNKLPFSLTSQSPDHPREVHRSIELPDPRTDQKRIEQSLEFSMPAVENVVLPSQNRDAFDGYRNFVEKSRDFIDETVPSSSNENKSMTMIDNYGYTEIYEGSSRDEKIGNDRYDESFHHEKFGNGIVSGEHVNSEISSYSIDSTDGSGCSRQAQTPDLKHKSLEKDKHSEKGVVNRAMMVARSIGLHSGSHKSSSTNSPRTTRKRNLLLAKRRNVSVKDVGPGELEGWLTYRSRGAGGAWARSWFVLKSSSLYRFKAQDSTKSDCLIALPGFTASTAAEVKSRKYAFKVYHTGTVFYFAADTEDSLALWLDSMNRATLGADSQNRTSGLFSETDESDTESTRGKAAKGTPTTETMFGSLKKIGRKDSSYKEHENVGASLDRKYLRFLGSRNQNVPVPTAQFRSYRRVLPTSTPNRKQDSTPNSPDLRVTVAGSTFYGLSASQSATDVPSTSQDMGDYRQTTDRSQSTRGRRSDDLRGFVTLEEFMLAHQNEDSRGISSNASSPRVTPLTSDHVHIQHRNFDDNGATPNRSFGDPALSNGMIYGHPKNGEESPPSLEQRRQDAATIERMRSASRQEADYTQKSSASSHSRKNHESAAYHPSKQNSSINETNEIRINPSRQDTGMKFRNPRDSPASRTQSRDHQYNLHHLQCNTAMHEHFQRGISCSEGLSGLQSTPRTFIRDNGYVGSSSDLTCCSSSSETLQRARKEASVTRKGSFNLSHKRRDRQSPEKNWMDSFRRSDKQSVNSDQTRLKNVAQYQPPPIPTSPFEQDGMRAAFEMHLDRGDQVQKTNRLKSFFVGKSPQKPNTLDIPKDSPKTLLGSPRLHRALFRDKSQSQRPAVRSESQSPGDSGISQSLSSYSGNSQSYTPSQSFSSVSSASDWSPDTPSSASKCMTGHGGGYQKIFSNTGRNSMMPPTLPYIPPPSSPPPDDYPGLEYPPVFEPGTYSLMDPSLIRNRNKTGSIRGNHENESAGQ